MLVDSHVHVGQFYDLYFFSSGREPADEKGRG